MPSFFARLSTAVLIAILATGCATTSSTPELSPQMQAARAAMMTEIQNEAPGNYFIGRRYFKRDYKFWGFVRSPRQPWTSARLIVLNEQQVLAPDRQAGTLGSDHNTEYKLYGNFSGDTVYEPASNGFYPEFVLRGSELRSAQPAPIFRTAAAADPTRRVIGEPF